MYAQQMSSGEQAQFAQWSQLQLAQLDQALAQWLPKDAPAQLGGAMQYAVQDGGKRLRPLLVLAASQAVHGHVAAALRAACAVELIHAYSLVHDDMPCMDNDVLRRGKPTVHIQFGQATALLTGDAMQALAFEVLSAPGDAQFTPALQVQLCQMLAQAAGSAGMAGGQAIDLASVGKSLNAEQLQRMHQLKTGKLLEASVMMGACTGVCSPQTWQALQQYGQELGLAYQVVDDILDVTTESIVLGKTGGKDVAQDKPTYVSLLGLDAARQYASKLLHNALQILQTSDLQENDTKMLRNLALALVHRVY